MRLNVAMPMRCDGLVSGRPDRAAMRGIPYVHWLERKSHLQEPLQLGNAALVVLALARACEHDVVVLKALGVSVAMQSIGHRTAAPALGGLATALVIRPRPVFVLALSSR